MKLGPVGIWSTHFRYRDADEARDAAALVDELGYAALWIPGGVGGDVFSTVDRALAATSKLVVATGILNIWMHDPAEVAASHAAVTAQYPGRFLLGLGVSHAPLVEPRQQFHRPLQKMREYLDQLDPVVPPDERIVAALGPKMLELARDRTAGSHPYNVTPEHTAYARGILGSGPLLAPEQKVMLETDPDKARSTARAQLALYFDLPNYRNNLLRTGFAEDDFANGGSDRLIDGLVAWGDVDDIAARVREHHDAGADHVCLQVMTANPADVPVTEWRELAAALLMRT